MVGREDAWEVLKSFLGSLLLFLLISLGVGNYIYTTFFNQKRVITLQLNIFIFILILIVLFLSIIYIFFSYSHMYVYNGREDAMKANLNLLKIKAPKDRVKKYILSTRISFWPPKESSPTRTQFRNLLTKKIIEGIEIKRIWQIWSEEDVESLEFYLDKYKNYDNLSLKYLIGKSRLPEILSVYGKTVSVSIPQSSDLVTLTTAFHFYGKKEILRWESYFGVLWEISIPVKKGNTIDYQEVEKLKEKLRKTRNPQTY